MSRAAKILFLPIILLQVCFFLYVSVHRLIDGDEGFYLLASRLVLQHRAPYLDFFYTQAPLLPYVYAGWLKLCGISWVSARIFSALLTTAVAGLLYWHVCRETGKWLAGMVAVYLFAGSSLVFAWYPIVKTFALAVLFLFAAYMILAGVTSQTPKWLIAAAGILVGLSADTRSYIVVVVPVFLWWMVRRIRPRMVVPVALFCAGLLIGLIPSLVLFVASPDKFWFNNLGYHAMRSPHGLVGDWQNKALVVLGVFGSAHTGFQFSVLTIIAVGCAVALRKARESTVLAMALAVTIGLVSLLPTPPSVQYFCIAMPFLIVAAVCAANDYLVALSTPQGARNAAVAFGIILIAYAGFGVPTFRQYLITGYKVPGITSPEDAANWTLDEVTAVSRAIDRLASPGEEVVSYWPGYLFASHADPYPGFENDFGMYAARRLSPEKQEEYRVLTPGEMSEVFAQHGPRVAVIGNQGLNSGGLSYPVAKGIVDTYGYTLVSKVGNTSLYVYRPRGR
jgi:4-amino-4-deoxy-L-arabinose transferase-like glycosyltransferase